MKRLVQWCVLFALCQCCVSNDKTTGAKENAFLMPGSILQVIKQAARDGNFSCNKRVLSSLDFFELADGRLLILVGIHFGTTVFFEAALVIALMGFVGTVVLSKFVIRGDIVE